MIEFARSEMEMAEEIARRTDGWSFAFLKELCALICNYY